MMKRFLGVALLPDEMVGLLCGTWANPGPGSAWAAWRRMNGGASPRREGRLRVHSQGSSSRGPVRFRETSGFRGGLLALGGMKVLQAGFTRRRGRGLRRVISARL